MPLFGLVARLPSQRDESREQRLIVKSHLMYTHQKAITPLDGILFINCYLHNYTTFQHLYQPKTTFFRKNAKKNRGVYIIVQ